MKKYILAIVGMFAVMTGFAQDALMMQRTPITAGQEGYLDIVLANPESKYIACQFDIDVPAGISIKKDNQSYTLGTSYIVPERAESFAFEEGKGITITEQGENHYRVTMYNLNNDNFQNRNGAILTLNVVASADFTGEYGRVYDIVLTNDSRESYKPEANVEFIKGDVNADNQVGIGDVVSVTNYMATSAESGVALERADVNYDGQVGIGDIVTITNIMAGKR